MQDLYGQRHQNAPPLGGICAELATTSDRRVPFLKSYTDLRMRMPAQHGTTKKDERAANCPSHTHSLLSRFPPLSLPLPLVPFRSVSFLSLRCLFLSTYSPVTPTTAASMTASLHATSLGPTVSLPLRKVGPRLSSWWSLRTHACYCTCQCPLNSSHERRGSPVLAAALHAS